MLAPRPRWCIEWIHSGLKNARNYIPVRGLSPFGFEFLIGTPNGFITAFKMLAVIFSREDQPPFGFEFLCYLGLRCLLRGLALLGYVRIHGRSPSRFAFPGLF